MTSSSGPRHAKTGKPINSAKLDRVVAELVTNAAAPADERTVKNLFSDIEARIVRNQILDGEPRTFHARVKITTLARGPRVLMLPPEMM